MRSVMVATLLVICARPVLANKVELSVGMAGEGTEWEGDKVGYSSLIFGYQLRDYLTLYFMGRLGYGTVDSRVIEHLDFGVKFSRVLKRGKLFMRAGLIHQHEIPWDAVADAPLSNILGWGDGIRHRGGLSAGLGVDIPLGYYGRHGLFLTVDSGCSLFADAGDGPRWSWGGSLAFGVVFAKKQPGDAK